MNNRIEINIIIVSDCLQSRNAMANLLLLKYIKSFPEDFIIEPSQVFMEIDMLNFPNTSKLCQDECSSHNKNISQQRKLCCKPIFYNCIERVNLTDTGSITEPNMNKNILLTFYFLSNNYKIFDDEFSKANIIIYVGNLSFENNELYKHVSKIVDDSNGKKYLLLVSNDNQKIETSTNTPVTVLMPSDYSDFCANKDKYLKAKGFITLKHMLASILNHQYKNIIDDNIKKDLDKMRSYIKSNPDKFITDFEKTRNKTSKLDKIFKKNYTSVFDDMVEDFLETCNSSNLTINLEKLKSIYKNNRKIYNLIYYAIQSARKKKVQSIADGLYNVTTTAETFLPSKIKKKFDELENLEMEPTEVKRLYVHICELYTKQAKYLSDSDSKTNIEMLYNTYFDKEEIQKMLSMLNEIISKIDFSDMKVHLIQIIVTKLFVVEKCIELKNIMDSQKINNIMMYLKALRFFLIKNKCEKYEYLFGCINDVCTSFIFKMDGISQLQYLSENIETVISCSPDSIIKLEKFIIKIIKKNSYRHLIAVDECDSDEDSDVDIYTHNDIDFTKDDYSSEDEDLVDNRDIIDV